MEISLPLIYYFPAEKPMKEEVAIRLHYCYCCCCGYGAIFCWCDGGVDNYSVSHSLSASAGMITKVDC